MASSRLSSSGTAQYFLPKPPSLIIEKELSRGAYGAVHCGRLDGKEVAVKRIHGLLLEAAKEQGDLDAMLSDFRRECKILERVNHPHIVEFKGAFYDESTDEPILVMELMKENLKRYLERSRGQLSRQKQLEICLSIMRGLRFLHTHTPPIVHRDLTDKNILLATDGLVKIGDLGQSRLKTADYFSTGQPGAIPFMSPEAMQQKSHYNEKLDVFSLGVLMLEVATQQPPRVGLVGIGRDPELQRRREDFSKLDEDHPLRPLILSCLKDDPKERPDIVTIHLQLLTLVEGIELQLKNIQSTASRPTEEVDSPVSGNESPVTTAPDIEASRHTALPPHTETATTSSKVPVSDTTGLTSLGPPQPAPVPVTPKNILSRLNHRLDAKWRHFGTFLGVEYQVMEAIQRENGGKPADCMLDMLGKWTSHLAGTGTLPRTWQTIVDAVQLSGDRVLAHNLSLILN